MKSMNESTRAPSLSESIERAGPPLDQPEEAFHDEHADDVVKIIGDEAKKLCDEVKSEHQKKGRRRADAILITLRAMGDEGRDPFRITADDANCIWVMAGLLNRVAGKPDLDHGMRPADSVVATGSAPTDRVLDPKIERGTKASRRPAA